MYHESGGISEAEIRRQVKEKYDNRVGLFVHLAAYSAVNLFLWITYIGSGGGFPWPLFVTGGWGIGMVAHIAEYYYTYGAGAKKREAEVEAEVRRQMQLAQMRQDMADDEAFDDALPKQKRRLELTDDGELIDIADYGETERERNR